MSAKPQKYLAIRETVNNTITIAIVGTPTTAITMHGGHLLILQEFKGCNFKDS